MNIQKKKKSITQKLLQWFSITALVLLVLLITIPFLFKDKIVQMVTNTINNNINATVTFKDADLSLLRSFPLASIGVKELTVVNKEPFLGDTLFNANSLRLAVKITELFKKPNETIVLQSIAISKGKINIVLNKDNVANYNIAIKKETTNTIENTNSFSFNIQDYSVDNLQLNYIDNTSNTKLQLDSIYHTGKGNFANEILDLDTKSTAKISFSLEGINYIDHLAVSLDAMLGIDLKNSKYTFKENTATINQLPLEFNGFIQLVDKNQLYDISFKTPNSSFKNALALLPKQYSGNLKSIKTEGNFDLKGVVKGTLSKKTIPTFNISFASKNALFKYVDLPKSVKNINIDSRIVNKTGFIKDTYVNLAKLSFKIDEDVFSANGNISSITTNPQINILAKGVINLANIGKVYPVALQKELSGVLKADISTKFDMKAIEKGNYKRIKNKGNITVTNFKYDGEDVAKPFFIDKTAIVFNTNTIKLNEFKAKTGTSDVSIKGNLDNFYGFLFKDQTLKGNFVLNSKSFKVDDFLAKGKATTETSTTESLKIPAFLDVKLNATAATVVYDNITLSNVSGNVFIKDETVKLKNITSDVFGGNIGMNGNVSTKGNTSKFTMDLSLKQLNIADSFSQLEMLKSIAPIAKTIEGKINSTIKVSGNLNDDMTPNLNTISGDLLGQLLNTKLKISDSKVLSAVGGKVDFLDISKLNLNEASALLSFNNGQVSVKPFKLNYKDIGIEIGGKHGFNNAMNYNIVFDVPVKYLGTEVTSLLSKLTPKDAAALKTIPVSGALSGSFSNPNFSTNIKDATSNLVKNIVEKQKQSLINKGKDKITDKLSDLLGGNKNKENDATKTKDNTKDKIKGILGGLFGKKKKDTTK